MNREQCVTIVTKWSSTQGFKDFGVPSIWRLHSYLPRDNDYIQPTLTATGQRVIRFLNGLIELLLTMNCTLTFTQTYVHANTPQMCALLAAAGHWIDKHHVTNCKFIPVEDDKSLFLLLAACAVFADAN